MGWIHSEEYDRNLPESRSHFFMKNILMRLILIWVLSIIIPVFGDSQNNVFPSKSINTKLMDIGDGLIVYYPFNGNANDESENGHHGIVNGAALTADRFGRTNGAYEFDGTDDFIQLPGTSLLELDFPISTSVWVSLSSDFGSFDNGIFNTDFVHDNYHGVMLNVGPGSFHQILEMGQDAHVRLREGE